jgi:hypothetical protein
LFLAAEWEFDNKVIRPCTTTPAHSAADVIFVKFAEFIKGLLAEWNKKSWRRQFPSESRAVKSAEITFYVSKTCCTLKQFSSFDEGCKRKQARLAKFTLLDLFLQRSASFSINYFSITKVGQQLEAPSLSFH